MKKLSSTKAISEAVMTTITSGNVRMKPRLFFIVQGLVWAATVALMALSASYLISIMTLWLRIQTAITNAYGARMRLADMISTFPWWALAGVGVALAAAIGLAYSQGRMYKHKMRTVALFVVALAFVLGLILSLFGFGRSHVPMRQGMPGHGWYKNEIK